ncbi:hypothetical protein PCIT_b0949 [Pseudoalteromonas citrea]|uniref:Uncharacterized protein n=1 Tax=Pseudoalteromonas citrea TaxID=43655 RepID=A0AAD4AF90_9GAMM|nr:hypothetical protein PCIT_b0949 [Pseudoalteromonas citrea]
MPAYWFFEWVSLFLSVTVSLCFFAVDKFSFSDLIVDNDIVISSNQRII